MIGSGNAGAGEMARAHPALTDAQTGLANGLHFDLVYNYLFNAGDRGLPFTVMLVSAGVDERTPTTDIRSIGQKIEAISRSADLVSHVGAGRYVVLLLGTNLQGGRIAADRIEAALSSVAPGPVCFGLAAFSPDYPNAQALMRAADTALLAAEAAGGGGGVRLTQGGVRLTQAALRLSRTEPGFACAERLREPESQQSTSAISSGSFGTTQRNSKPSSPAS